MSYPGLQVGPVSIGKVAAISWETRTALLHFHGMSNVRHVYALSRVPQPWTSAVTCAQHYIGLCTPSDTKLLCAHDSCAAEDCCASATVCHFCLQYRE